MNSFAKTLYAVFAAALLLPAIALSPASAVTAPARGAVGAALPASILKVHRRSDDSHHRRHYGRHHRHHRHVVDAPFTRVETNHANSRRRVIVDAPFAHVSVGRRGRHVRAPFVDLWLPR